MAKFCANCGKDLTETNGVCPDCNQETEFSKNGMIDRKAIKAKAREMLSKDFWTLFKPMLILLAISFVISLITGSFGEDNTTGGILSMILELLTLPLTIGLVHYYLNYIRNKEFSLNDLLEFYKKPGEVIKIFLVTIIVGLLTALGAIFLIIPGVIVALMYAVYNYVLADERELGIGETLSRTSELMKGHKSEFFVFMLSFIGWILLGVITFGIALIYVMPYVQLSEALYYEELKKLK